MFKLYEAISEKAQKNTPKSDWNLLQSHNMRKYFNSTMLNAGADSFHIEFFIGHTLDDTKAAYFRASPDKLKELYLKFVPYLIIQKELNVLESPDYIRIKSENQILQAETVKHVVDRSELQELRKELYNTKELLQAVFIVSSDSKKLAKCDPPEEPKDPLQDIENYEECTWDEEK